MTFRNLTFLMKESIKEKKQKSWLYHSVELESGYESSTGSDETDDETYSTSSEESSEESFDDEFCKKWKVYGEAADYPQWQKYIEELPHHLKHRHFRKLLIETEAILHPCDTKSSIHELSKHYKEEDHQSTKIVIGKKELEIWTCHNIIALIKEHKEHLDVTCITDLREDFICPLMGVIDKAREHHKKSCLYDGDHNQNEIRRLIRELEVDLAKTSLLDKSTTSSNETFKRSSMSKL